MVSLEPLDRPAPVRRALLEQQDNKVLLDPVATLVSKGRVALVAHRVAPERLDQLDRREQLDHLAKPDHKELVGHRVQPDYREQLELPDQVDHWVNQDLKAPLAQLDQLAVLVTQGLLASLEVVDLKDLRVRRDPLEQLDSQDHRDHRAQLAVLD